MTDHHEPAPSAADDNTADLLAFPSDARPLLVWAPANPGGGLSPQLARFILDGYTAVGDVVIDVDDDVAFAATAAQTGRRHHALGGAERLATLGHAAGYIDLMLLRWPRPAIHPHWQFLACRALLRNAGCLVVAVTGERHQRIAHLSAVGGNASTAGFHLVDHLAVLAPEADAATPPASRPRSTGRDRRLVRYAVTDVAAAAPPTTHTDVLILTATVGRDE